MESNELRNQLLSELIGKMQSRLADKEYPEEKKEEAAPVESSSAPDEITVDPSVESDELSDEDMAELMKAAE